MEIVWNAPVLPLAEFSKVTEKQFKLKLKQNSVE